MQKGDGMKASKEQKELIEQFEKHTCFEFMKKEEVRSDAPRKFIDLWTYNIMWLEDLVLETKNMLNEYRNKH